jgi:aminopeptidase N
VSDPRTPGAGLRAGARVGALAVVLALTAPAARAQPERPYQPRVDVQHYTFALSLPDTGAHLTGHARVRVVRTAPTDTLRLDLVGLRVTGVRVGGRPVRAAHEGARLHVPLPPGRGDSLGDTLEVEVRYAGVPTDGLITTRDPSGRWQAFGDNWPDRARHWLPVVDHPSDKATVTWEVTAPRARTVVANGTLLGTRDLSGGRRLTRWREDRPIPPHLMVVAAAPLERVDLGDTACGLAEVARCVPQQVYVAPGVTGFGPGPFAAAGEIVAWLGALVGPFPYAKLAHVQSATRFGGMENAGAIFYADQAFRRGTLDEGLIAHEVAHQWFGDAVTQREWAHLWLSEGFATYLAALWTRRTRGDSAFRAELAGLRQQVTGAREVAERPVLDTGETTYLRLLNANSYQKGAWVLHMLRAQLGDSAFFGGVRAYHAAHRHGTALTGDLQAALEASAGRPLGPFLDQWLRRPGFPELTTRWVHDAAAGRVRLTLAQGTRFAPFAFPLAIDVELADGTVRRTAVEVPAEREATVELPLALPASPRALRLDPDVALLATFAAAPAAP